MSESNNFGTYSPSAPTESDIDNWKQEIDSSQYFGYSQYSPHSDSLTHRQDGNQTNSLSSAPPRKDRPTQINRYWNLPRLTPSKYKHAENFSRVDDDFKPIISNPGSNISANRRAPVVQNHSYIYSVLQKFRNKLWGGSRKSSGQDCTGLDDDSTKKNDFPPQNIECETRSCAINCNKCVEGLIVEDPCCLPEAISWITSRIAEACFDNRFIAATLREFFLYTAFATTMIFGILGHPAHCIIDANCDNVERRILYIDGKKSSPSDLDLGIFFKFDEITSIAMIWKFLESFASEFPYSTDKGCLERPYDGGVLIGYPRIWQLRTIETPCHVPWVYENTFNTCLSYWSKSNWCRENITGNLRKGRAFDFASKYLHVQSQIYCTIYPAGGHVATLEKAKDLGDLKKGNWIGNATRVLFFEYFVYCRPKNNLIGVVMLFEILPSKAIKTSCHTYSIYFDRVIFSFEFFNLAIEMAAFLFLLFFFVELIREAMYFGRRFFCSIWTALEIIMTLAALLSYVVGLMIWFTVKIKFYHKLVRLCKKQVDCIPVINLVITWQSVLNWLHSVVIFIAVVKFIKYLSVLDCYSLFHIAIMKAGCELIRFLVIFYIMLSAFSLFAMVVFGPYMLEFRTFLRAFLTNHFILLGEILFIRLYSTPRKILAFIYIFFYFNSVVFVVLNYLLATFSFIYGEVKCAHISPRCRIPCQKIFLCCGCSCICPRPRKIKPFIPTPCEACPAKKACIQCIDKCLPTDPPCCENPSDEDLARFLVDTVRKHENEPCPNPCK